MYNDLKVDLWELHMSKDEATYEFLLTKFREKYETNHNAMFEHIWHTWIRTSDHTCNWQSFRNKPGFANTNSPLESFNNLIKTQFMKRIVMSIGGALSKLEEIIIYFSNNRKKFNFSPRFVKTTHELASSLTKRNFRLLDNRTVAYTGKNNKFTIDIANEDAYRNCSCNCMTYMKDGICAHLVGYSWIYEKNLYRNYSNAPTKFATQTKRGRHKHTQKAGNFN